MLEVVCGVPVMVKSLFAVVELLVSLKKVVFETSGRAVTVIVTPADGRAVVMETRNGNVGPGAGGSVLLSAGVVVAAS